MSDRTDGVSRRALLGSVATIGGAAALGGVGSIAFLSDREEFANNRLVAGELDLRVDWQEHYSDWSDDEEEGIETVSMTPGDGLAGFPSAASEAEQSVFVSDPDQFLDNTAIEAYPDVLDDEEYDALQAQLPDDSDVCDLDADTPEVLSSPLRTQGAFGGDPNPQTTEPGDPLIAIEDLKPGDFGELTLSFHVCGNPGFVWLTGALRGAAENGLTEPEREDPDEDGDPDSTDPADVELLDEIRAAFWYDTGLDGTYGADLADKDDGEGDNYRQDSERPIVTGTLGSVLEQLETAPFPLDAEPLSTGGETGDGDGHDDGDDGDGAASVTGDGADLASEVIVTRTDPRFQDGPGGGTARNYQCPDYEARLDVGDIVGSEVLDPDTTPIQAGTTYPGCTAVTVDAVDPTTGTVTLSTAGPVTVVSVKGGPDGENVYVFDDPVVLDGVSFTTPGGDFGISNVDVCCPVGDDGGNGGGQANGDRQCFPASTTAYVGFEWWLPVDHADEIQTDSVQFDLGFYTEQCRHNDGELGNDGPGGGQNGDDDDGDGGGQNGDLEGDQAISFIAACTESESGVTQAQANFRVTDVLDRDGGEPTAVTWEADEPIDAVVLATGSGGGGGPPGGSPGGGGPGGNSRFTTYFYDPAVQTGDVATGADEDGSFDDRDGSPETYPRSEFGDQSSSEPCPSGYSEVVKLEEEGEIDP